MFNYLPIGILFGNNKKSLLKGDSVETCVSNSSLLTKGRNRRATLINKMKKKNKRPAAYRDSHKRKDLDLEKLMEASFKSQYPICREVKSFLDVIEPHVDDHQLGILTDSFLGFSAETQREMLECILLNIVHGAIEQTGVTHIDILLCDMRDVIYEAIFLPDLPISKTICEYSKVLLEVFSLMNERKVEWELFQADYCKLLEGTYKK